VVRSGGKEEDAVEEEESTMPSGVGEESIAARASSPSPCAHQRHRGQATRGDATARVDGRQWKRVEMEHRLEWRREEVQLISPCKTKTGE
jgi:hypothetical protein